MRSRSGIGSSSWWPNSCQATSWWGTWSTVVALKRLRVRSDFTNGTRVGRRAERVRVGVAEVDADGVAAVPVQGVGQPVGDQVERLVPADLLPVVAATRRDRPAQPVGVVVHVGERDALGADVAARERVVGVAPDRR